MDSFELNKVVGAVLGTVFVVFTVSLVSDAIFSSHAPETPGYAIAAVESGAADSGGDGGAAAESILPLLASASAEAGAGVFKRCAACHTTEEGGANKAGPNLYGVVDRPVASHAGFSYSAAMQAFSEGGSVVWDYEHLDHFITNPKAHIPGTAMAFAGLKKVDDRANVVAYLRTLAASPAPLPEAGAEAAPSEEAPAEAAPAEAAPAEEAPTEAAPAEEAPAEEAPTEAAPATEAPAEAPAAEQPATEAPAQQPAQ